MNTTMQEEYPAQAIVLPDDAYNRKLVDHTHPAQWTNPTPGGRYNLVVIGAGTAGLVTAVVAAGLGAKVALIEKHLMGGDCLNVGCVPSKGLIRAARAMADVRDAGRFGVEGVEDASIRFGKVMERMRRIRSEIAPHDSARRFSEEGVDVYIGEGRFRDAETVEVGGQALRFRHAVIATGARAFVPPVPGLAEAGYLTNETVFELTELPGRLAVLGGGPIGAELSQAFARFGAQVHLIEMGAHILGREDADAAAIVQAAMLRDGVRLHTGTKLAEMRGEKGGVKTLMLDGEGGRRELEVDAILVAVGRAPNVRGLNLEAVGVEYDERQGVKVDDTLRTSNPRIYAAGDICSSYKFTHAADAMAAIVIQNTLFGFQPFRGKTSKLNIPWATYTDPEIAHVGLYEHQARERGIEIETVQVEMAGNDRAQLDGETEGFLKVHVEKGKDRIVGATLVARHAGDMLSEITVAMNNKVGLTKIAKSIHPYPTQAEIIRRAGLTLTKQRFKPSTADILKRIFEFRR